MNVALIGPYPLPYGGISIHLQRMAEHLEAEGIEYTIYDDSGIVNNEKNVVCINNPKRWLLKYLFFAKEDIIHYHSPNWILRVVFGLMSFRGKKTIISIHGESLNDSFNNAGWFQKKIMIYALKHTSFIICVNTRIKDLILSMGVKYENIEVIPAFIPPTIKDKDIAEIPKDVWTFMDSHNPVISANAFQIKFYNGQDLYGIDMCIDMCADLKQYYPKIGFIFCLPDVRDYEYFKKMNHRIAENWIEQNFLFITEENTFYPILMKSNVFVRPTNTDGDAVSIREALYFKIPTVASDIVPRPIGTNIFKSRDISDFTIKTKNVLDNYEWNKKKLDEINLIDNSRKIIELYQNQW